MKNKKGFTLIELLAVIVILAIIALIVTPVVSNIVANARIAANARSVEGHIRNIELAIITKAFGENSTGDLDSFDTITSGATIESSLSRPGNDNVTCTSYTIKHGTVLSASGCKAIDNSWDKKYNYSVSEGAYVFEFNGTVIWPGLDSNGIPTQNVMSSTLSLPMADSEGNSIVTYLGIVYMDPTNVKAVCNASSTITTTPTGCKKFYIYEDSGSTYKMINDRNTTSYVEWNSTGDTSEMKEAMEALLNNTAGWIGTPDLISADEIAEIVGANLSSTIKWNSNKTYNSVSDINTQINIIYLDGGRNSNPTSYSESNGWQKKYCATQGCSNYAWLFDYTDNCTTSGCNISLSSGTWGYWTKNRITLPTSYKNAWFIRYDGFLRSMSVTVENSVGIRPVLEIPKSLIG